MVNLDNNKNKIIYTLRHRYAFKLCVEKYCPKENLKELLNRSKYHDMDKVILSCLMDGSLAAKVHRLYNKHHNTNNCEKLTKDDLLEIILDWECSRYTKPDKPRNAYDTLYKFYPEIENYIMPILKEIGLDKITSGFDEKIKADCDNYSVDDKAIEKEINSYIDDYKNSVDKYAVVEVAIKIYLKRIDENL